MCAWLPGSGRWYAHAEAWGLDPLDRTPRRNQRATGKAGARPRLPKGLVAVNEKQGESQRWMLKSPEVHSVRSPEFDLYVI